MRVFTICRFIAMAAIMSIGRDVLVAVERSVHIVADVSSIGWRMFTDIVMMPFRVDYGAAFELVQRFVLSAFMLIGMLKPEYDESLETDGQSFETRLRFASRC